MSASRKKIKDAAAIITLGIAVGLLYPMLVDGFDSWSPIVNGFLVGLLGSSYIVLNEIVLARYGTKKNPFTVAVITKTLKYTAFFALLVLLVVSITRAHEQAISVIEFISDGGLRHFIVEDDFFTIVCYALGGTFIFIFSYQMSKKMGQGVLWNFIIGKYHQPREEELVFMFLDLNDSTQIAERIGPVEVNNLLNSYFIDITSSVVNNYGRIYRYVGDEVVVTWKMDRVKHDPWFIKSFYDSKSAIENVGEKYLKRYGFVPSFTAAIHKGKVVVGELGIIKTQISFLGEVLYEGTLIEKQCKRFKVDLLLSEELVRDIEIPSNYKLTKQGPVPLTTNKETLVYSVTPVS